MVVETLAQDRCPVDSSRCMEERQMSETVEGSRQNGRTRLSSVINVPDT